MLSEATRPPWLSERCELERFIEKHNPSLNILQLRCDRNRCQLVNDILNQIVSHENVGPRPSQFEMNLAKIHLAVDLQNILQQWCGIGLQKTMEGSALWNTSPSGCRGPTDLEKINTPKLEVASPPTVFSPTVKWGSRDNSYARPREIAPVFQAPPVAYRPAKRPLNVDQYEDATKVARVDKTSFLCPYYTRDPNSPEHADCAKKTFPNPRKLKEHVWRWLKPFKCSNCGEGFGREKTRAIHCEQRKTKCKKAESKYEESPEYRRDILIESAKSTQEMIDIFERYEKERDSSQRQDSESTIGNQTYHVDSERSSTPGSPNDSQNGSLDNGSDSEMDSGEEKYVELEQRPLVTTLQNSDGVYIQQNQMNILPGGTGSPTEGLSPQTPEDRSRGHGQLSMSPMCWEQGLVGETSSFDPHNRRKSAPSAYYSSVAANNFTQQAIVEVPAITITEPEPLNVFEPQSFEYSNTANDTESYYRSRMEEETELSEAGFNGNTGVNSRLLDNESSSHNTHVPTTVPFISQGFGSWGPFTARFRYR